MKYAQFINYDTDSFGFTQIRERINLGDNIQSMSIKRLFSYCGIGEEQTIKCSYFGAGSLSEPCALILQGHFSRHYNMDFMYNPNICPVFLGFALMDAHLLPDEIRYIKKFEPVLCRDEFTKTVLNRYDIDAYISGCLSLTFDRREDGTCKDGFYYFVDIKEKFRQLIPDKILNKAVFLSQNMKIKNVDEQVMEAGEAAAKTSLEDYKKHAKMIITSKLHCMCPGIAMGIPTIAVSDNFSARYSFVDAFVKNYDEKEFAVYDWARIPEPVDIEYEKKLLLDIGKSMLQRNPDMEKIKELDCRYTKRKKWNYCSDMKREIRKIFRDEISPEFILWGAAAGGHTVYHTIQEMYPHCRLLEVADRFNDGVWEGKIIKRPEEAVLCHPGVKVIVSTLSGMKDAEDFLQRMEYVRGQDYFVLHESM